MSKSKEKKKRTPAGQMFSLDVKDVGVVLESRWI